MRTTKVFEITDVTELSRYLEFINSKNIELQGEQTVVLEKSGKVLRIVDAIERTGGINGTYNLGS
jgi:hypothetical protein